MTRCRRETEIVLAAARHWSTPDDAALAGHAAECPRCLAVMAEAAALQEACARDLAAARVPSPAIVWWRLERRLREDRARAARRALTIAHGIAGAIIAGVVLALAQTLVPSVRPALTAAWSAAIRLLGSRPEWLALPDSWTLPVALMVLLVLVLAPTAVYVGLGRADAEPKRT